MVAAAFAETGVLMSNTAGAPPPTGGGWGGGGVASQIMTVLQQGVVAINQLATNILNAWPRITGTFTLAAAASTTVAQPGVKATSQVYPFATNASAGTLMGSSKSLYVSAIVPGASFTVHTADGTNAAGTETFGYSVFNPS
jgi:hypothetical protein